MRDLAYIWMESVACSAIIQLANTRILTYLNSRYVYAGGREGFLKEYVGVCRILVGSSNLI